MVRTKNKPAIKGLPELNEKPKRATMVRTMNKPAIKKPGRLKNLKKKTSELSVLCGVEACLLYCESNTSDDGSSSSSWHTWPEDQQTCLDSINKYKSYFNEPIEPKKKTTTEKRREETETVLEDRQPVQERESHELKMGNLCLDGIGSDESKGILRRLNEVHMALEERIQFLKKQTCDQNSKNDEEWADSELMNVGTCHPSVRLQKIFPPLNEAREHQSGPGSGNQSKTPALWDLNLEPPEEDEMNDDNDITSNSTEAAVRKSNC